MKEDDREIQFHFVKNRGFRVIHADGAFGGITPKMGVFMTFYSERPPIPKSIHQKLSPEGVVGEEILEKRNSKSGIVREAEFGVLMDLVTTRSLVEWLQKRITQIESAQQVESTDMQREESK